MRSAHYITQLKTTKIPLRHVVLDTEAIVEARAGMLHHRWLCGHTTWVQGDEDAPFRIAGDHAWETPVELWEAISDAAARLGELVLWAHNLPYDLRVADGLDQLVKLDWTLDTINLARTSAWSAWTRKGARLLLCDSSSWLVGPLDKVASDLRRPRALFDYRTASPEALRERCRGDSEVLARAVACVLTFLAAENLGSFRPTGSAMSHVAWRRRWMPARSVLAHNNAEALLAERTAMHAGRTEAWVGGDVEGPLHEMDMELAYCRIAASHALPQKLYGERYGPTVREYEKLAVNWSVLAEVTIKTDLPLAPVTLDDRVLWPVGEFKTTLWDPEVLLALRRGAKVTLGHCWLYTRGTALMEMSQWLIDQLGMPATVVPPVIKRMLKHWARTLVGRCALRFAPWEFYGEHPISDLCISWERDEAAGRTYQHLRIGHKMLELGALTESTSSVPQIPGWVMSRCRANLWAMIEATGEGHVAYMDTDGLLCDDHGLDRLRRWQGAPEDVVITHKATHPHAKIYGPRNVVIGDDRRLSGVPKKAVELAELEYEGEVWRGLESALAAERTNTVDVAPRRWAVTPSDSRRVHLKDGTTEPHRLELNAPS